MHAAEGARHSRQDADLPDRRSVGKLRGLQQMADANGVFAMCAMDHRGSMQRLIQPDAPMDVTHAELTERKLELARALAPASTAVLLDPMYGAAQAIAAGALPGRTALLVSVEETGYETAAHGRVTTLLPEWGAEKVGRMGGSAVKILLYYRPDLEETAERQRNVVREVAAACARADLPFLLEPIAYPVFESEKNPEVFAAIKTELVIRSARELTALGVDVLKAEFPAGGPLDLEAAREACERLNEASCVPWILLSAGVPFDEFSRQVEVACEAGASGFLGGRAIWEEAFQIAEPGARREWLATVGADRLRSLHAQARQRAAPWWTKWGPSPEDAGAPVSPEWYRGY